MKLKTRNLNRVIKTLTNRAVDLYLYLVKRQDKIGSVKGIYYKTVMEDLHMPRSTFYSSLVALEKEKFISISNANKTDYDIFIFDNRFVDKSDFREGYVNLNLDFVLSRRFVQLKVKMKKFLLRMVGLQANVKEVKLLNDKLKEYCVFKKLKELEEFFIIKPDGDGYTFIMNEHTLEGHSESPGGKDYSSDHLEYKQKVISYCRIFKIDYTEKELLDTYRTMANHMRKNRGRFIIKAFDKIIETRRLQPKLISYLGGMAY